jgi:hypothetical protein
VGPRTVLDAVVKRKIPIPRREPNPRTLIVQPVRTKFNKKLNLKIEPNNTKLLPHLPTKTPTSQQFRKCRQQNPMRTNDKNRHTEIGYGPNKTKTEKNGHTYRL